MSPVLTGSPRASSLMAISLSYRSLMSSPETSSVAMPVQPESTACSARYSSARDAERCRLHAHREVLRDDRDLLAVLGEMHRDGEDAACRCRRGACPTGSTEASVFVSSTRKRATFADRHREVEPAVLDAQFVEVTKRLPGEVADLGVVALALEFGDHHDRDHDGVLGEAEERPRIAQQHRGVEDVRAQVLQPARATSSTSLTVLRCCGARVVTTHSRPGWITRQSRVDQGSRVAIQKADPTGRLARCHRRYDCRRRRVSVTDTLDAMLRAGEFLADGGHHTRADENAASASPKSRSVSAPVPTCGATRTRPDRAVTVSPWLASDAASGPASCGAGASVTMPARRSRLARGQHGDARSGRRRRSRRAPARRARSSIACDPDIAHIAQRRREPRGREVIGRLTENA